MRVVTMMLAVVLSGCSLALDFDERKLIDAAMDAEVREGGAVDAGDAGDAAIDANLSMETIQCGTARCKVGSEICCKTTTTQACQPAGTVCSGLEMGCDGTEDCPGEVCCGVLPAGPLLCLPYGFGASRCSGKPADNRIVICHQSADCVIERPICQQCMLQGTPIRSCTDILTTGCTAVP